MSTTPPPPPPPPPGENRPYPGTGFTGFDQTAPPEVYHYGGPAPGALARAPYGSRVVAFLIDQLLLFALPVAAAVALRVGPRRIQRCELTEDGNVAILGQEGVVSGLCEVPAGSSIAIASALALAGVTLWFWYMAREGRTGQTVGKRAMGLRTVDIDSGQPLGAGRNIGRNLVRAVLALPLLLFIGFVVDHLFPLFDRRAQCLHDKATNAAVTTAQESG